MKWKSSLSAANYLFFNNRLSIANSPNPAQLLYSANYGFLSQNSGLTGIGSFGGQTGNRHGSGIVVRAHHGGENRSKVHYLGAQIVAYLDAVRAGCRIVLQKLPGSDGTGQLVVDVILEGLDGASFGDGRDVVVVIISVLLLQDTGTVYGDLIIL